MFVFLLADCQSVRDRESVFHETNWPTSTDTNTKRDTNTVPCELVDPTGAAFVIQAYCVAADPSLSEASLPGLEDRLALPEGWRFVARTLDVDTRSQDAMVVQDELQNSYCRYR